MATDAARSRFCLLDIPPPWCSTCEKPMIVVVEQRDFVKLEATLRVFCHGEWSTVVLTAEDLKRLI